MTKYRSRWQEIELVEVERETESCVWINGRKNSKATSYECYHDTAEQAKQHIIAEAQKEVDAAKNALKYKEDKLEKARNAKMPNDKSSEPGAKI